MITTEIFIWGLFVHALLIGYLFDKLWKMQQTENKKIYDRLLEIQLQMERVVKNVI